LKIKQAYYSKKGGKMPSLLPFSQKKEVFPTLFERDWPSRVWDYPFSMTEPILRNFPVIYISKDEHEVCVKAEIPGMSEKDIEISYHDGLLNISGEKKSEREEKGKNTYYRESYHGSFSRSIPLEFVDWHKIHASFKNGMLLVTAPKNESAKANRIKIEAK